MIRVWLFPLLLLCALPLRAQEYRHPAVDAIVASGQPPEGVVFDLVTWGDRGWDWASPMLRDLTGQLRRHYPELEMALVSHGFELFDLSERSGHASRPAIQLLRSLADDGLRVHVGGRYASTRLYQPEDFLPFVDVAASGEAQVEDYLRLGFVRIELEPPDGLD